MIPIMKINDPLLRFSLWTLFWLPLFFTFWYLLAPLLLVPLVLLTQGVLSLLFPGMIEQIQLASSNMVILTQFPLILSDGRNGLVTIEINALKYAYNLPLLMALLFAAQEKDFSSTRILLCYIALLPFQLWGICFEFLLHLSFRSTPELAQQLGLAGNIRNFIGLGYQFGVLMLPAISAAAIWVAMNRRFIAALATYKIKAC